MTDFVLVGCKLPHGLILEVIEPGTMTNADGKEIHGLRPRPRGKSVTIKGACSLYNQRTAKAPMQFGYGITPVDKSLWEAWYARNKDTDMVRNGLVFVADESKRAEAIAKERQSVATGLEPLSGDSDPRMKPVPPDAQYAEPNL